MRGEAGNMRNEGIKLEQDWKRRLGRIQKESIKIKNVTDVGRE